MGCAGLSLAVHFIKSKKFSGKKILLVDKERKDNNDRTWCFWEKEPGLFDHIVHRKYHHALIFNGSYSKQLDLSPYQYKLIRGIDFYEYALSLIRQHSNFKIIQDKVDAIGTEEKIAWVKTGGEKYTADYIFNSILFEKPVMKEKEYWLLQHFKGWVIETGTPVFNREVATLMDFRVPQKSGTSFVYIMPFSETRALVEYTLFTEELIPVSQYEEALKTYIDKYLQPGNYGVIAEETGVIPMTNHRFQAVQGNIINIGTAGGQTKGSSGYTFHFIQKHSARITASLVKKNNPFISLPTGPARFRFYDSVLLRILKQKTYPGNKIFTTLFRKNETAKVLRFLDNESSWSDEIKLISSLPTLPFLKAAIKHI